MSGWFDLPVTFFDRIFVDGITAARMTCVCKTWRRRILQIPRLKHLIHMRFEDLTGQDPEVFCKAFSKNYKKLKYIADKSALDTIAGQGMDIKVDIRQLIPYMIQYLEQTNTLQKKPKQLQDLLNAIGYFGEGICWFKNPTTGDIIVANDFYAGTEQLFFKNDMSMGVHKLEPFRILEKLLPGIFDWKVIRTHTRPCNFVIVGKWEYHRDTCIVLRFKNVKDTGPIRPKLGNNILTDAEISAIVTIRDNSDKVVKKKKVENFLW
jgi:hypothetical protein